MGKRSNFERVPRDYYPTPPEAVAPLLPHLSPRTRFCEPCAGNGALLDELVRHGHVCARARDIEPQREDIERKDALTTLTGNIDCFITNPPWDRKILHPLIEHLSNQTPCWLLLDADWPHTKQSARYINRLRKIISIGRVKWIPGSKMTGKDNCCWYLFDLPWDGQPQFFGRT